MKKILFTVALVFFVCLGMVSAEEITTDKIFSANNVVINTPSLDVVFVIDTTGSMSDEIREVKMHIKNIIIEIQNGTPKPDVCIGFVVYRDYPDEEGEYLFKIFNLTSNIDQAIDFLNDIEATGGGDYEEAVTLGLDLAINDMEWREIEINDEEIFIYDENQNKIYNSTTNRRMIFLIGDAPPRTWAYENDQEKEIPPDYKQNIKDAQKKGIFVYTISGSGMSNSGIEIWKEIAEKTNAEYEQLIYERVELDEYVKEYDLEEEWVDKVRNESYDYDHSSGTFSTNQLSRFVKSNVKFQAESIGVDYVIKKPKIILEPEHKKDINDSSIIFLSLPKLNQINIQKITPGILFLNPFIF